MERRASNTPKALKVFSDLEAVNEEVARGYPSEPAPMPEELRMPVDQLMVVLDHWISIVGEDHVSLGSDLDGWLA